MKSTNNYINNKELAEQVKWWILNNYKDNHEWLERHNKRTKKDDFYNYRKQMVEERTERIKNMTDEERKKFYAEVECKENKLFRDIYKVIDGRLQSYKLYATKPIEDIEDVRQFAAIQTFKYLNRWDFRKGTSCFAYLTEVITQAFNLWLKGEKDSEFCRVLIDDFEGNVGHERYYGNKYENEND